MFNPYFNIWCSFNVQKEKENLLVKKKSVGKMICIHRNCMEIATEDVGDLKNAICADHREYISILRKFYHNCDYESEVDVRLKICEEFPGICDFGHAEWIWELHRRNKFRYRVAGCNPHFCLRCNQSHNWPYSSFPEITCFKFPIVSDDECDWSKIDFNDNNW